MTNVDEALDLNTHAQLLGGRSARVGGGSTNNHMAEQQQQNTLVVKHENDENRKSR